MNRTNRKIKKVAAACLGVLFFGALILPGKMHAATPAKTLEEAMKEIQAAKPVPVYYEETETNGPKIRVSKTWYDPIEGSYRREDVQDGKLELVIAQKKGSSVIYDFGLKQAYKDEDRPPYPSREASVWDELTNEVDTNDPKIDKTTIATLKEHLFVGEEEIIGRPTYHFQRFWTFDAASEEFRKEYDRKEDFWFDKETGTLLKSRRHAQSADITKEITKFEKVAKFPDQVFDLAKVEKGLLMEQAPLSQPGIAAAGESGVIQVKINGTALDFEQPPVVVEGNTLVPLRAIFEKLGASIDWNEKNQSVLAKKGQTEIRLRIGSKQASVGDSNKTLEVPAQIINGSTMVPVRFVSEALGANVKWDAAAQTVVITTG